MPACKNKYPAQSPSPTSTLTPIPIRMRSKKKLLCQFYVEPEQTTNSGTRFVLRRVRVPDCESCLTLSVSLDFKASLSVYSSVSLSVSLSPCLSSLSVSLSVLSVCLPGVALII